MSNNSAHTVWSHVVWHCRAISCLPVAVLSVLNYSWWLSYWRQK